MGAVHHDLFAVVSPAAFCIHFTPPPMSFAATQVARLAPLVATHWFGKPSAAFIPSFAVPATALLTPETITLAGDASGFVAYSQPEPITKPAPAALAHDMPLTVVTPPVSGTVCAVTPMLHRTGPPLVTVSAAALRLRHGLRQVGRCVANHLRRAVGRKGVGVFYQVLQRAVARGHGERAGRGAGAVYGLEVAKQIPTNIRKYSAMGHHAQ